MESGSELIEVVIFKAFLCEEPLCLPREVQGACRLGFEQRLEKFFAYQVGFELVFRSGKWLVNGDSYVSSHL